MAPVHFVFVFGWKRKDQQINLIPPGAASPFYHFKSFTSSPFPVIWNSYSLWDISVMRLKISSRLHPRPVLLRRAVWRPRWSNSKTLDQGVFSSPLPPPPPPPPRHMQIRTINLIYLPWWVMLRSVNNFSFMNTSCIKRTRGWIFQLDKICRFGGFIYLFMAALARVQKGDCCADLGMRHLHQHFWFLLLLFF